ncbi:MAG: DNA cytosine methyltransferase [Elusimicrobiota bacterium]|nr:DNA cytosine methyltransferase [Elusimicrobiota bacterium]
MAKPTVIDLFSGCGGLSLGFQQAGYEVLLGVDHDQAALNTYQRNFPKAKAANLDLSQKGIAAKIRELTGRDSVDAIVAGPPCQGFSLTGPRNFDDKRNKLYLAVLALLAEMKPKCALIENVPGMLRLYDGAIHREIVRRIEAAGYRVAEPQILCAADYGVPQMRRRAFIVAVRRDYGEFSFPEPTNLPAEYVSCGDAIGDLPSLARDLGSELSDYERAPMTPYQRLMRAGSRKLWNHTGTKHTDLVVDVISQVPEGGDYRDLPPGVGTSRRFNEAWTRYHRKKPSHTIDTGHRNHFHYKYNRVPTVRENARLQSFPDKFIFTGTKTQQNRQVGNAVPPLLAEALARQLLAQLSPLKRECEAIAA